MIYETQHLGCLAPYATATTLRQMTQTILALLCIADRVTTLGLSRCTAEGGSYRTLQRWYQTRLAWDSCYGLSSVAI